MLEIKSQKTKPVGGSNLSDVGARRFQPNHRIVQVRIMINNPFVNKKTPPGNYKLPSGVTRL
jgi:hypothetical protein